LTDPESDGENQEKEFQKESIEEPKVASPTFRPATKAIADKRAHVKRRGLRNAKIERGNLTVNRESDPSDLKKEMRSLNVGRETGTWKSRFTKKSYMAQKPKDVWYL
jgi:hypothetical protein